MNNWYVEMDLVCTPATAVTQMFSVALIGILLCVLFAPLSERLGRKNTVIAAMIPNLVA